MNKILNIVFIFFVIVKSLGQNNPDFSTIIESLLTVNITEANKNSKLLPDSIEKQLVQWHIDTYNYGITDSIVPNKSTNKPSLYNILQLIKEADIALSKYNRKDSLALEKYSLALDHAKTIKDTAFIRFTYYKLLPFFFKNKQALDKLTRHTNQFKNYIKTPTDEAMYAYLSIIHI